MKKLLTILLLIILAGQATGYFNVQIHEVSLIQEAEEKGGEENHEKEFLAHVCLTKSTFLIKPGIIFQTCVPTISPVLDHLSPPPDVTF